MNKLILNEVPRNPIVPKINQEVIALLSELCFREDDPPEEVDLIFVFSSAHSVDKHVSLIEDLLDRKISKKVFISGGLSPYLESPKTIISESALLSDRIHKENYPDVQFYLEDKSRNTLENVTESLKVMDFRLFKKILFVFKTHAAGRGHLTLKKFMSADSVILQKTWAPIYPGGGMEIHKYDWSDSEFGMSRVWGEYLRIKKYGERGDIAYPKEVKDLVDRIEKALIDDI